MLTITGEEATLTVAGRVVVPGVTATVLTMVVPAGTLSTVGAEEGGIFWVAAAAAASAAMPLICGLLPITCGGTRACEPEHWALGTLALSSRLHQGASFLPRLLANLGSYHQAGNVTPRQEFVSSSGSSPKSRVRDSSLSSWARVNQPASP